MRRDVAEKLFEWSSDKIRWYHDAQVYPGNNRDESLAQCILSHLPEKPCICEFGCGIGGLSMELSKRARRVTAIDSCGWALSFMFDTLIERRINNVDIIQGDFSEEKPNDGKADAVVICMVGQLEKLLSYASIWTDGKVFFITETPQSPGFGLRPKRAGRPGPESVRRYLKASGLPWEQETILTALDQPFISRGEAFKFCRAYNPSMNDEVLREYLDQRLLEKACGEYKYLLPCGREYAVFTIG